MAITIVYNVVFVLYIEQKTRFISTCLAIIILVLRVSISFDGANLIEEERYQKIIKSKADYESFENLFWWINYFVIIQVYVACFFIVCGLCIILGFLIAHGRAEAV